MFRRLFVLLLPHVSCRSMALLYYKDPHLSLATGILYNFMHSRHSSTLFMHSKALQALSLCTPGTLVMHSILGTLFMHSRHSPYAL